MGWVLGNWWYRIATNGKISRATAPKVAPSCISTVIHRHLFSIQRMNSKPTWHRTPFAAIPAGPLMSSVSLILLASCGRPQPTLVQCNQLTQLANDTVEDVQVIVRTNAAPNATALTQVSERFDQSKEEVEALQLSDSQLQTYQQQFLTMYTETSRTARELAIALDQQAFEDAREARTKFQAAISQESTLVEQVNTYCEPQA